MSPERPISQSKPLTIFISLIVSAVLLVGCGALASQSPTPVPPTATPLVLATVAATIPAGPATPQAPLDTPTSIPPSPTPELPTETATSVLLNPLSVPAAASIPTGSIAFNPGTTATVVQGTLQPGQVATYTLGAGQSQPLILIMDSPNNDVTLGVFESNGNILLNPANKWRSWQGILPATELYTLQVTGGATTESFSLTVKAALLVNFAAGTSSITLTGTTAYGYLFSYGLNCGAGQTMTAALNVPSSTAYLDIFGIVGGTLLNASTRANSWSGVLPQTTDYVIEVIPTNNQVVNYSLTVSVTGAVVNPSSSAGDIIIKPGSTAAVKHGTVGPGQVVKYTLQASNSQPLLLNVGTVGSTKNDVTLGLIAPDGVNVFDPAKKYLNFQVPLRETGLYTIEVFGGSTTENFELTVKLPRIVFFSGTDTVTIKSATEQGFIVSYAFYGNFGQTLTASLNVPSTTAYLDVFGIRTGGLLSYADKANSWTGVLPETEMYVVEVIPRGGQIVGYSVTLYLH